MDIVFENVNQASTQRSSGQYSKHPWHVGVSAVYSAQLSIISVQCGGHTSNLSNNMFSELDTIVFKNELHANEVHRHKSVLDLINLIDWNACKGRQHS